MNKVCPVFVILTKYYYFACFSQIFPFLFEFSLEKSMELC